MGIGDWCVGGEAESVWGPGPVFLGMFLVMELPSCLWPVRPFSFVYHQPMTLLTLLEDLKAPPEMKGVSDTSQSLLDGCMGSGRELSNFPADLSARNIPLWACFSLNRILLDRSGPGSCPGVLGSVEEGPHTLLAVRNGLADHWSPPQLEKTHETPPSSREEGHLYLHGMQIKREPSVQATQDA